jgi:signal transduction histidine kinase
LTVVGDPSRLRQLVTNLVDNALRFAEPGGSVTLRVDGEADRAMLRVTDTGVGIPAEHLPHVFERFYQADGARSSGGCGLGLSICRWIVAAHGGTIGAASGAAEGTVFTATLPTTVAVQAIPAWPRTSRAAGREGRSVPMPLQKTESTPNRIREMC